MTACESMGAEEAALLAAIHAHPDDDTPRLVYADWLDEHMPAQVVCPKCKGNCWDSHPDTLGPCPTCGGTGSVQSPDAARAELIRHQIACHTGLFSERHRKRESDLRTTHEPQWRAGPGCEQCGGRARYRPADAHGDRVDCPACWGGDRGGLLRTFEYETAPPGNARYSPQYVRLTYDRGLMVVQVPRVEDITRDYCPECGGYDRIHASMACERNEFIFRPTPWLHAVATHHPHVVGVVPLDRVPLLTKATHTKWFGLDQWFSWINGDMQHSNDGSGRDRAELPGPIFTEVAKLSEQTVFDEYARFRTRDAAVAALGRAVVRWARAYPSMATAAYVQQLRDQIMQGMGIPRDVLNPPFS